jgi:hypothetical protein
MRYFRTTNATRLYRIGNKSFKFEICFIISSSWIGVYQTEDNGDADLLANHGAGITEIDESTYDELKKKDLSSMARQKAPSPRVEKKESPVVIEIKNEILLGKATYQDSIAS